MAQPGIAREHLTSVGDVARAIIDEVGKAFIGSPSITEALLTTLVARGHVLIEGNPGVAKTTLVKAFATTLGIGYRRVQFTPDLLPSDITGTYILDMRTNTFVLREGPVFTNVLLGDEINRAPAKTQSALLEAMQERAVTVAGRRYALDEPFVVLATQNPLEMEGTYPLPEAQLDRFFFKLQVPFPSREELHSIIERTTTEYVAKVEPVVSAEDILGMQKLVRTVPVARHVQDYAVRLLQATHPDGPDAPEKVRRFARVGASPRGAQAVLLAAKIRALFEGRFAASVDDVKASAAPALRHRMLLNFEGEAEGVKTDDCIREILEELPEAKT